MNWNCPVCESHVSIEDRFCRSCGLEQRNLRLPVKRAPAAAPALWRQAAPVLARGVALVVAGVAAEWLMRSAAKRALGWPSSGKKSPRKSKAVAARDNDALQESILAISETVVMRRVIVRR